MKTVFVFWIVVFFWFVVNAIRVAIELISPKKLERMSAANGLHVGVFSIEYRTTALNRFFNQLRPKRFLSQRQYRLYKIYFRFGYWMSILLLPFVIIKLLSKLRLC